MLFFAILVILASIVLGLIVLVQNPKGGGLSGTFGGVSNQLMGVKQTTDVLEKGTWIFAGLVAVLCIISPVFIPKNSTAASKNSELIDKAPVTGQPKQATPSGATPIQSNTPAAVDTGKH